MQIKIKMEEICSTWMTSMYTGFNSSYLREIKINKPFFHDDDDDDVIKMSSKKGQVKQLCYCLINNK